MGKAVESRWTLKDLFTPKVKDATSAVGQFKKALGSANAAGKTFVKTQSEEAAALLKQKAALKESTQNLKDMRGIVVGILPLLGIGVGAALGSAVKSAMDFQDSLATVGTLLSGSTAQVNQQLSDMASQLESLSRETGKPLEDLADGLYQTISAGVDAAHSMTVLTASTQAAIAGLTDTNTAVDVVTSALNAYHLSADQAENVTDVLLKTVQIGKTTFPELAQSMGLVLPSAASLHISFTDLNSSIGALTLVGLKTPEAISGLNEAFMNILKPTAAAQAEAKKLGIQFNAQALSAKGLIPFLQEIKDKTHGNTQAMSDFFGSIQGLNAMLALTSNQGMEQLISAQQQMQNASGTTAQQYKVMTSTLSTQWKRASQDVVTSIDNIMLKFHILDGLSAILNVFTSHSRALTPVLIGLASALGVFVTTLGVYVTAMKAAEIATKAFGNAAKLTPIGVVATLIGLLVGVILWLANNMQTAKLLWMEAWNAIVKATQAAINAGIDLINGNVRAYKFAFDTIKYAGVSIWDAILKAAQSGINLLLRLISPVSGVLKTVGINIPTSVNFSGAMIQANAPTWDTSVGLQHVNLTGALYSDAQLSAQAKKAQSESSQLTKSHIDAINKNTDALSKNTGSTDANTSASSANTKALAANTSKDLSADLIADTLMPRLERHLYGTS